MISRGIGSIESSESARAVRVDDRLSLLPCSLLEPIHPEHALWGVVDGGAEGRDAETRRGWRVIPTVLTLRGLGEPLAHVATSTAPANTATTVRFVLPFVAFSLAWPGF